jgi:hypothetical protein
MLGELSFVETVARFALAFQDFEFKTMNHVGRERFRLAIRTNHSRDRRCVRYGLHGVSAE